MLAQGSQLGFQLFNLLKASLALVLKVVGVFHPLLNILGLLPQSLIQFETGIFTLQVSFMQLDVIVLDRLEFFSELRKLQVTNFETVKFVETFERGRRVDRSWGQWCSGIPIRSTNKAPLV
jgi:hypothetical protein